ncbi:hypothetical protein [Ralstonia solanacearum]|uniref:Uncharacterized protein n=1 Tax=Ralstonia solanacearum TaxID=305 RepID=A0AAE3NKG0_RALSL|nr:hypothetical protein [Ralstonia solanacearum]MBB6580644.1 hypothetical protein [Ralstonia solanacearum]MDB0524033.1 hypothetical protein [Ralstonia solanacearum]
MITQPYPDGIDCVWIASDRNGHLGAFITAGVGPIPAEALKSVYIPVEDIEGQLCLLPIIAQAELLVSVKRPDDFIDLAERGVFVYDWTDINRTARDALRVYEPVAVPTRPIMTNSLPDDLSALAKVLELADVVFSTKTAVDIRALVSCAEAG